MNRYKGFRLGIFLTLIATFLHAIGNALHYVVIPKVGPSNVTGSRYAAQGLLAIPFFVKKPDDITNPKIIEVYVVLLSGIFASLESLFSYMSFNYIPIMDATVLFSLQPLIVLIIATIWLKEKAGCVDVILVLIVLLGVLGVCQPEFMFGDENHAENSWLGYVFGICSCITTGISVCIRRRVKTFNTASFLIIQSIVAIPMCFVWAAVTGDAGDPTNLEDWLYFISGVAISTLAKVILTVSLKYEEAYIVALISTTEILFSMVSQIVLFEVFPNWIGVFGALAAMSGVIMISVKSQIFLFIQKLLKKKDDEKKTGLLHENVLH